MNDNEIKNFIKDLKNTEKYSIYGETTSIPAESINPKFSYFYKPYNYNINTKMYMTYKEEEGTEKLQGFDEYVRLKREQNEKTRLEQTRQPATERGGSVEPHSKSELFKDRCSGWQGITNFLLGDPRTRRYVVDQIRQMHDEKLLSQETLKQQSQ